MGISIHYHGRLDDTERLDEALRMIETWCRQHEWSCHRLEFETRGTYVSADIGAELPVELDTSWRGWSIDPHDKCESLVLAFDDDGRLMLCFDAPDGDSVVQYRLSVTTQYAPPHVHVKICELLRQLQRDFAREGLEVVDEGDYFDSRDKRRLVERRDEVQQVMGTMGAVLGSDTDVLIDITDQVPDEEMLKLLRN